MKWIISILVFCFFFGVLYAQEPVEVIYHQTEKDTGGEPRATLIFFDDIVYLSKVNDKSLSFIDYKLEVIVDVYVKV